MKRKFYRELWSLRFQKMLDLEKKSVVAYQSLVREYKDMPSMGSIRPHLERLILDERRHIQLVKELIRILDQQPEDVEK